MSHQRTDEDVEQCTKAEMKTLHSEEYKRTYGEDKTKRRY